ncbi:hypothetical protein [Maridesulfovibrio hydrothermalis]|uniref:Uncharacterized protein n=1 Tax=Maridesulfovibrio hydrothermalis AM13 = DSM 14728 TaxID=1121451 RepID=L0REW5_9BACT|nr:hypothetical protein [Maridesulfovibrio hydrothermalis]CCO24740.1 conserved protein of unknown function [Maridesulfovibrio hydrothermalis AM13 = DSM 14728]
MNSNFKWRSLEILANDRSWTSLTLLEMKKMHDQLQSDYGVWSNTQDTVATMNSLKSYKEFVERTEGRVVSLVINGVNVPYDLPKKTKA